MMWLACCAAFAAIISAISLAVGPRNMVKCLAMMTQKDYWKPHYNKVEFAAYMSKGATIVPGLIFKLEVWWLHFITLSTSVVLIWVSERKLLPALVIFNTIWIFISTTVLVRHLFF